MSISPGEYNRENAIQALKAHADGHIKKHCMNVEIYLKNQPQLFETEDQYGNDIIQGPKLV